MLSIEVNQRIGIIATSGVGKSTAAYTLLEDLRNRKYPVCVLDIKNEYGDLPKTPIIYASQTNAAKLVQELKNTNASCIVFMSDLSIKKKQKWIAKFLKECHKTPRDIPIMVVIEEVRLFAPQKKHPSSKEPIEDLAQGGRSQGYGCMLISQRCSNVEKDVLGSLTDLFIMQHTLDQDREYLSSFIGKEKAKSLSRFKKGQAYHVNFEQGSMITEIQFPNNPRKKKGGTPQPTQVEPIPLQMKKKKEKPDNMKGVVIGGIIAAVVIVGIIFIIIYFYINKPEEKDAADSV